MLKNFSNSFLAACLLILAGNNLAGQSTAKAFISFDGVKIVFSDEGVGEPIFLLHGFINTRKSWEGTALKADLLAKGYRVIIPDLRGNGDSDRPQTASAYADNAEVKDLMLLAEELNLPTFPDAPLRFDAGFPLRSNIALGYSRGSIVLAKWLTMDSRIQLGLLGGMGLDFSDAHWPRRIKFMNAFLAKADLDEDTEGAVNYAKSIDANLLALAYQQAHQPVTSKSALMNITIPCLVIAGDEDIDNGSPKALSKCLKNGRLEIVPGDHNTCYRTAVFAEEVIKYLSN